MAVNFEGFIDSLFDFARDPHRPGLSIQMKDGHYTHIDLIHEDKIVVVKMDDVNMGFFEEYTEKGYKCRFNQKYRVRIREGLTPNEAMMESICDNPLVLLHKAY